MRSQPSETGPVPGAGERRRERWADFHRAFVEFLTVPSIVVAAFVLLAILMLHLDSGQSGKPAILGDLFSDAEATRDFLSVVANGIITVTSITFSLLLLAVQQGANDLTSVIFDQFLRRRTNQIFFGFFTGLALYSLIVLTSVSPDHQPALGAAAAGFMTLVALCMLIFLIYSTVNQMRPVVIIKAIHDHTLIARSQQLTLLKQTYWPPRLEARNTIKVAAASSGFLTGISLEDINQALAGQNLEVIILASIGDFVAFGDEVAEIRSDGGVVEKSLADAVRRAVMFESQRDLDADPAFGIEQLITIAWTSISTAKSDPEPGLLTIWSLRDLLARWLQANDGFGETGRKASVADGFIAYHDNLPGEIMRGLESLAVAASESLQHQCTAEIYRTFARSYHRLPAELQARAANILERTVAALGDHVLTTSLDDALTAIIVVLEREGNERTAGLIRDAQQQLAKSIGQLNSRSTRVKAAR